MSKELKDCNIGDFVRVWCIGPRCWDDITVKIIDNGISSLIKVQYPSGATSEFVPSLACRVINF